MLEWLLTRSEADLAEVEENSSLGKILPLYQLGGNAAFRFTVFERHVFAEFTAPERNSLSFFM